MNANEPVAWIDKNTGKPRMEGFIQADHDIPLYTHPVKKLTDEKILNLWWDSDHTKDEDDLILTFVKRILKER